jgi:phage shock protein C
MQKLTRSRRYKALGGVCAGIALTKGYSITLTRIIALLLVSAGVGVPLYLIAWILLPKVSSEEPVVLPADPLMRSLDDRIVGGVCAGLADYAGWDTGLVRVIFAVLVVFCGMGLLPYIYAWMVVPQRTSAQTI